MKRGDFSRLTYDRDKSFLRVQKQQGRVELDADWTEQVAILLDTVRTVAADLIGPYGAPQIEGGFAVEAVSGHQDQYSLTPGRFYVGGLLCRNAATRLSEPPDPLLPTGLAKSKAHLLFLDAWERDVTWIQDAAIRESALGGLDTALRSQVVWRLRAADFPNNRKIEDVDKDWGAFWVEQWQSQNRGKLEARAKPDASKETGPCVASPEALYRGLENQLYRVEIHTGGKAGEATFKWSRENGSVTFAVHRLAGETAWLEHLGRDARTGLQPGDWVELLDDERELADQPGILLQVESPDARQGSVKLELPKDVKLDLPEYEKDEEPARHPYLRRWDHREGSAAKGIPKLVKGALAVTEGADEAAWINLEDGVQIRFQPGGIYRAGDYWQIPARVATGDVEWPGDEGQPEPRPPHGPEHHYAPLAHLALDGAGNVTIKKLRKTFKPAA
jgi:hypothetical protein